VSSTLALSSIKTVKERREVVKSGGDSPHRVGTNTDPEFMEEARIRREAIVPYAAAGLAAGSILLSEVAA